MPSLTGPRPGKSERAVYDAGHGFEFEVRKVRGEGDPEAAERNVNNAYDHAGAARELFRTLFSREGIDDAGMDIRINVNYGVDFGNAFWDGERIVLVQRRQPHLH
jgi:Zn-dependent metalloprotease